MITVGIFNAMHSQMPSRRAQSSVVALVVTPMALAKPFIHSPLVLCSSPPPPTRPGFPSDDPSVFSLTQFFGGRCQWIWIVVRRPFALALTPSRENSVALATTSFFRSVRTFCRQTLYCCSEATIPTNQREKCRPKWSPRKRCSKCYNNSISSSSQHQCHKIENPAKEEENISRILEQKGSPLTRAISSPVPYYKEGKKAGYPCSEKRGLHGPGCYFGDIARESIFSLE